MSPPPQIGNPPDQTLIYHITDVANLPGILADGGLHSDAVMAGRGSHVIGYGHIKARRLTQNRIPCCSNRFVGEFVPFYFCPRSPMLYVVNNGNTGRPAGCQRTILHLVSRLSQGIQTGRECAISDVNAGSNYPQFGNRYELLQQLDWAAIRATQWQGKATQKAAEFLVADFFPWTGFHHIGCHNSGVAQQVTALLQSENHQPTVSEERSWYY